MALPVEFNTGRLTGHYVDLAGNPMSGQVSFSASPIVFIAASSDTVVVPIEIVKVLDANGAFTIDLPATDDEDITPTAWTYTVREVFLGFAREYPIQVPVGSVQDVTEINPIEVSQGVITTRGPRGRSVTDGIINGSGHLILTVEGNMSGQSVMFDAGYVLGNAASQTAFSGFSSRMDNVESQLTTGTSAATPNTFMRRDSSGNSAITSLDAGSVTLGADPADANKATRKSYVDALVAPLTAATASASGNSLVKRDADGSASFAQATVTAPNPTAAGHLTRKSYVDAADTALSGRITTLETDRTAGTEQPTASTAMRRDANGRSQVAAPSAANDILNLGTAAATYLPLTQKGAANGVAALDAGQRVLGSGLDITKGAAPAAPGAGVLRWYVSTADTTGQVRVVDEAGLVRRANMDWGAAGSLPAAANALRGDTAYHTGMGTMFQHNGTSWVQAGGYPTVVANATARTALSTNYPTIHHNFHVFEQDTSRIYRWISTMWEYVSGGTTPRIPIPYAAGWQDYSPSGSGFEGLAYVRTNGMIFMSGLISNVNAVTTGSAYNFIAVGGLPVGTRPQKQVLAICLQGQSVASRIDIQTDGSATIAPGANANAAFYFGLNMQWAAA